NLTIPAAHADIGLRAVAAGKSVYGEKPLASTTAEARRVLDEATLARVRIGCAPDTVLGTGIQTARKAIDDGVIGSPIAATATLGTAGPQRWHPGSKSTARRELWWCPTRTASPVMSWSELSPPRTGRRCQFRPATSAHHAASECTTWPVPPRTRSLAPAAGWHFTCWTSWSRCFDRRTKLARWRFRVALSDRMP